MAIANIEIPAVSRDAMGKGASRRLRKSEHIPAILYGGDEAPRPLTLEHRIIIKSLENEAIYSSIFNLNIEGKKQQVVLRDLQRHPFKPKVLHVDFLRVKPTDMVTMRVPIHFIGQDVCPAVKLNSAVINHQMIDIEIKCQAGKLPEYLEADLSNLTVEHAFHISDLKLPEGAEIPALALGKDHDLPIASAYIPRSAKVDDEESTGTEEDTKGEANS